VFDRTTWTTSGLYEEPDHLVRRITPPPEPLPQLQSIPFGPDTEQIRERLAPELIGAGLGEAKTLETLLAATEIAANAIQHGLGIEDIRVGNAHGRFVCEITDRGPGFDNPRSRLPRTPRRDRKRPLGRPSTELADRVLPIA
jgi:hypothetical protein